MRSFRMSSAEKVNEQDTRLCENLLIKNLNPQKLLFL